MDITTPLNAAHHADAECPVKHLPLGVKLIRNFLSDAEQRGYTERLLQEPLVRKQGTLNFQPALSIDKLRSIEQKGNAWLRRLTHGNDWHPFTWSNGHFYNGAPDWAPQELGAQPPHRDTGADVDRTLGVSIGAGMWFHYSLRGVDAVRAGGGAAGGAFEHHVYVQSGDALLFDGMTLTHAADNLQPGTEPAWWGEVVARAGAGNAAGRVQYEAPARYPDTYLPQYVEAEPAKRHFPTLARAVGALREYPDAAGVV